MEVTCRVARIGITAALLLAAQAVSAQPDANDDVVNVAEGGSVSGNVMANDSNPGGDDDDALLVRRISGPAHAASFQLQPNGNFSYTHDGSETTADAVVYELDDRNGGTDRATLSLIIQPRNDPPVAVPDALTVDEGGVGAVNVLANDTDPEGDSLSATIIGQPAHGSASRAGGIIGYRHDGSETTSDTITYQVSDGQGGTAQGVVSITINPVNETPVANNDAITVDEGQSASGNVLANDADPDGDALQVRLITPPARGSLDLQPGGGFTYNHDGSETTADSFVYEAFDGGGLTDRAQVNITIRPRNDPPRVVSPIPNQQAVRGQPYSLNVAGNFTDDDGDSLSFSAGGLPKGLGISSAGVISGSPTESGNFSVTVTARDPAGAQANDQFALAVSSNEPPRIVGQKPISTREETPVTIRRQDLEIEDPDSPPGAIRISVLPGGNYRVLAEDRIEPDKDFFGNLPVRVVPRDEVQDGPAGTVTVTVINVQDDPVAVDDEVSVDEGRSVSGNVLANDIDPDDDDLTARLERAPEHGQVTLQPNGSFTYRHDGSETTEDEFRYLVDDGNGNTDRGTVEIDIRPVNDPPVAVDDEYTVREGGEITTTVTNNDKDPEGDDLKLRVVEDVSHGSLRLRQDGRATYEHDGSETTSDQFVYEIEDEDGLTSRATVTYVITAVNDAPTIVGPAPGRSLSTPEETPLTLTAADFEIEDPDTTDASAFSIQVVPGKDYTVSGNTLTPEVDFNGVLSVAVTASDGQDSSEPFVTEVTVTAVNDAPTVAGQVPLETAEDEPLEIRPADLVITDPDNEAADFRVVVLAGENYTASGSRVIPNPDYNGSLSVPVQVSDGEDASEPFAVEIGVTAVNDAPRVATPIPDQQVVEDDVVSIATAAAFEDVDEGDTLRYAAEGLPESGNLVIDAETGLISGTAVLADTRDVPYPVTVTATDAAGESVADTFQLTVAARDRANLGLSATVSPTPAVLGDTLTWELAASNDGPSPGDGIQVSGRVSGPELQVQPVGSDCTLTPVDAETTAFTCAVPRLSVGAVRTVSLATTPGAVGDLRLAATVGPSGALPIDPNPDNNTALVYASVARALSNGPVQSVGNTATLSVAVGDVNGDGLDDVLLGTAGGVPAELYFGNGDRGLDPVPSLLPDSSATAGLALADLDGDGDLDLVLANASGAINRLYLNDGSGVFTGGAALGAGNSRDVAVGDVNGDGFPDVVFANQLGNTVWINDGSGSLTQAASLGNLDTRGVAVGDLNGDGLDDLVFANVGAPDTRHLALPDGGFANGVSVNTGDSVAVALADLDGDTDLDLVFANASTGASAANPVLANNGNATFSVVARLGNLPTDDVLIVDADNDGRPDLLFVSRTGGQQIWLATPDGYVPADAQMVSPGALAAAAGEFSQESGTDLVFANGTAGGADVFLNDTFGTFGLGDAIPPQITLIGEATLEIPAGSAFNDPGASAMDNVDGDISSSIIVVSTLNSAVVGTYTLTYLVSDTAGNEATPVSRTVRVAPAEGTGGGGGGATGPGLFWLLWLVGLWTGKSGKGRDHAITGPDVDASLADQDSRWQPLPLRLGGTSRGAPLLLLRSAVREPGSGRRRIRGPARVQPKRRHRNERR